jgi:hypothetical protein
MPIGGIACSLSFAGIYVELIFAAFAAFLWAVVQTGMVQGFPFQHHRDREREHGMFNANPLMRFDGYYIMIDLIETPNLQQKSRALIQHKVTQWLFGSSKQGRISLRGCRCRRSGLGFSIPTPCFVDLRILRHLQFDSVDASALGSRLDWRD